MTRFTAILALSMSFISITGCAMDWTRPGTSEQELNADKLSCEQDALKLYPVTHDSTLTYRPMASSKLDTSCVQQTGFNNCDAAGNVGAPSADGRNNVNDYNRSAAVKACLTTKGYTYNKVTR
jgi:hypothetical protein